MPAAEGISDDGGGALLSQLREVRIVMQAPGLLTREGACHDQLTHCMTTNRFSAIMPSPSAWQSPLPVDMKPRSTLSHGNRTPQESLMGGMDSSVSLFLTKLKDHACKGSAETGLQSASIHESIVELITPQGQDSASTCALDTVQVMCYVKSKAHL